MKVAELEALLSLDDTKFQRGMDGVDNRTSMLGGAVGKVGAVAVTAFAGATVAAGAFGVKAVMAGSDLAETISKNTAVFKDQAGAIEKWAGGAAKDFGQSKQQALDAAGSFGNLFVQLGIGRKEAAGMSTSMVELASDFASFQNADVSQVLEAQTAAFRGEYDALQRFVPTISAATVEQEAMAMTGKKNADSLTAQEKALATQSLMMKGAGDAMGDFDRTNAGLANRTRIAKAQFSDFTAELGMKLIPVVLGAWDLFDKKMLPVLEKVGDVLGNVGDDVADFFDGFKNGTDEIGSNQTLMAAWGAESFLQLSNIKGAADKLTESNYSLSEAFKAGSESGGHFEEDMGLVDTIMASLGGSFDDLRDLAGQFFATFSEWIDTHQEKLDEWKAKGEEIFGQLMNIVQLAFEAIRVVFDVVTGVIGEIWERFGSHLIDHIAASFDNMLQIIGGVLTVIQGIFNVFIGVFTGDWGRAWDGVKQIFSGIWDIIVGIAKETINKISLAIGLGMAIISAAWAFVWGGIKSAALSVWGDITSGVTSGINTVVEIVKGLPGKVSSAASGAFDSVKEAFKTAINWIIGKWNDLGFTLPEIEFAGQHIGGNTVSTPNIPMLANGGRIVAPGLAIIGERGPELLQANAGASVIPLDRMSDPSGGRNVTIEKIEINANDADEFLAALPQLERALAAGVGRMDRTR